MLINLHGGGFTSDSGSLLESIPIASLTGMQVIAVEYRLAPEFPFPAAVDDSVAVYKELLKTHAPRKIAVYGTSAGASLTTETAVQLGKLGIPLPAASGFFSGYADFARSGDSHAFSVFVDSQAFNTSHRLLSPHTLETTTQGIRSFLPSMRT